MQTSLYHVNNERISGRRVLALISDLHCSPVEDVLEILKKTKPDIILAPGDIFERLDGSCDEINERGFALLRGAAELAPTYFSLGNHEIGGNHYWLPFKRRKAPLEISEHNEKRLTDMGVRILRDEYEVFEGLAIGGLGSAVLNAGRLPALSWLDSFCNEKGAKVLLCHHPEYYEKYLKDRDIDLIVSGHAHGGQWRFFGRGVFAPGQGLFPKYTSGLYDGRLVVSRGMKHTGLIPRIFNKPEVIIITVN